MPQIIQPSELSPYELIDDNNDDEEIILLLMSEFEPDVNPEIERNIYISVDNLV